MFRRISLTKLASMDPPYLRRYWKCRNGNCHGLMLLPILLSSTKNVLAVEPNARHQARRAAGARHERTLAAVACMPWFGTGWARGLTRMASHACWSLPSSVTYQCCPRMSAVHQCSMAAASIHCHAGISWTNALPITWPKVTNRLPSAL